MNSTDLITKVDTTLVWRQTYLYIGHFVKNQILIYTAFSIIRSDYLNPGMELWRNAKPALNWYEIWHLFFHPSFAQTFARSPWTICGSMTSRLLQKANSTVSQYNFSAVRHKVQNALTKTSQLYHMIFWTLFSLQYYLIANNLTK